MQNNETMMCCLSKNSMPNAVLTAADNAAGNNVVSHNSQRRLRRSFNYEDVRLHQQVTSTSRPIFGRREDCVDRISAMLDRALAFAG